VSLREELNTRSTFRFSALNIPIRTCIRKSRPSAAPIKQPTAVCHSSRSCSAFGSFSVSGGILKRDELATAGQRNRIVKLSFPAAISHSATTRGRQRRDDFTPCKASGVANLQRSRRRECRWRRSQRCGDSLDCCSRRTRGFARGSACSLAALAYREAAGLGWSMASPKTRAESPTSQAARGCVVTSMARKRPRPGTSQRRLTRGIRENPVAARVQRRARQTRQHSLTGAVVKCEFHTSAAWRQAWP
jgi:hypothetical protein